MTPQATEIVPGAAPTLAESVDNPNVSGLQRALRDINPAPFVAREGAQAAARRAELARVARTPEELEMAREAREATTSPMRNAVFANSGDADPRAVDHAITRILRSPAGQRDAVAGSLKSIQKKLIVDNPLKDRIRRALAPIRDALRSGKIGVARGGDFLEAQRLLNSAARGYTSEDDLASGLKALADKQKIVGPIDHAVAVIGEGDKRFQNDPAQLYGIRQAITDKLSPLAARAGSDAGLASRELQVIKRGLDGAIERAVPGFKNYLGTYAEMSRPIDQMEYLQGLDLGDKRGDMTLAKVQGALKRIKALQGARGVNAAKSLTDDQIQALRAIRDDLLRAERIHAGKSLGSPTVQNAINNFGLGRIGRLGVRSLPMVTGALAGGLGGHLLGGSPEAAAFGGGLVGELGSRALQGGGDAVRAELERLFLTPSAIRTPASSDAGRLTGKAPYLGAVAVRALPFSLAP